MSQFIDIENETTIENEKSKDEVEEKKKTGRKPLIGGLSSDTFFTLSHTLRAYSDIICYLLDEKKFYFVLPGNINNDRIEIYFSYMRYLSGMHLSLDIASFCQNARTDLLRTIVRLCEEKDGSHSKIECKKFFDSVKKLVKEDELANSLKLREELDCLSNIQTTNISKYLSCPIIPYLSGYAIAKHMKNTSSPCKKCIQILSHGINVSYEIQEMITYNATYLQERDMIGLNWPHENAVILAGAIFELFSIAINSDNMLKVIKKSAHSSSAALSALRSLASEKIHKLVSGKCIEIACEECYSSSKFVMHKHITRTLFNMGVNNFTMLLNRKENSLKLNLKLVKLLKQKDNYSERSKSPNDSTEVIRKWTIKMCKENLKLHNAPQTGNLCVLQDRCILLRKLENHNLQLLFSQSIKELSNMSKNLHLPKGTKDEMVKNISEVII